MTQIFIAEISLTAHTKQTYIKVYKGEGMWMLLDSCFFEMSSGYPRVILNTWGPKSSKFKSLVFLIIIMISSIILIENVILKRFT